MWLKERGGVAIETPTLIPTHTLSILSSPRRNKAGDGKPPYSYANLITFAIKRCVENLGLAERGEIGGRPTSPPVPAPLSVKGNDKKMTLSEIYKWITDNFPYYKTAGNGWKVCLGCEKSTSRARPLLNSPPPLSSFPPLSCPNAPPAEFCPTQPLPQQELPQGGPPGQRSGQGSRAGCGRSALCTCFFTL